VLRLRRLRHKSGLDRVESPVATTTILYSAFAIGRANRGQIQVVGVETTEFEEGNNLEQWLIRRARGDVTTPT